MPPPRRALSWLEPVVMQMSSERRMWNSVAVVKPIGTSLEAAVRDVWGVRDTLRDHFLGFCFGDALDELDLSLWTRC